MAGLQISPTGQREYQPDGETLRRFILDSSHVSIIRGPIGSGTSTASCMKIWRLAMAQRPGPDGKRRTRWGIVRNTYPELVNTTLETWLFWFPEEIYGKLNRARPMRHHIQVADLDVEVFFLALDGVEDVQKLRSLEVTGWWFNEVEYTEKGIFDEAESRTGRYPSMAVGGPSWDGVIADMNAPTEDHWVPRLRGEVPLPDDTPEDEKALWRWPANWEYFVQPPALVEVFGDDGKTVVDYVDNPRAENRRWLKPGFYDEKRKGKSKAWIDSRLMNRITIWVEGKPVWPNFRLETHVSPRDLDPVPGYELVIGQDFGRRPCALICQPVGNRFRVLEEFRGYDMGATTFAPMLRRHLSTRYPDFKFRMYGDPKGRDRTQAGETTAFDIFHANGLPVLPAPVRNNNIEERLEAVEHLLNELADGQPRFTMSPQKCPTLKVAMAGKYCYAKRAGGGYADEPEKRGPNAKYSDIADALQYAALGAGEGRRLVNVEAAGGGPRLMRVGGPKLGRRKVA